MMSWFPIFFPLKDPLYVPDASTLVVSIWRETDGRMVWYEWVVEGFAQLRGGGRVRVAMSEVGRSRGKGCLM